MGFAIHEGRAYFGIHYWNDQLNQWTASFENWKPLFETVPKVESVPGLDFPVWKPDLRTTILLQGSTPIVLSDSFPQIDGRFNLHWFDRKNQAFWGVMTGNELTDVKLSKLTFSKFARATIKSSQKQEDYFHSIWEDEEDRLNVVYMDDGLFQFRDGTWQNTRLLSPTEALGDLKTYRDQFGHLYTLTVDEVWFQKNPSDRARVISRTVPSNTFKGFFESLPGHVWFYKFNTQEIFVSNFGQVTRFELDSDQLDPIVAMFSVRGVPHVATANKFFGLVDADSATKRFRPQSPENIGLKGLGDSIIVAFQQVTSELFLIDTILDGKRTYWLWNSETLEIRDMELGSLWMPTAVYKAVFSVSNQEFYVGDDNGIYLSNKLGLAKVVDVRDLREFFNSLETTIVFYYRDRKDRLWIATRYPNALLRYDP